MLNLSVNLVPCGLPDLPTLVKSAPAVKNLVYLVNLSSMASLTCLSSLTGADITFLAFFDASNSLPIFLYSSSVFRTDRTFSNDGA